LDRENWLEQLSAIFMTIRSACKEATLEDIACLEAIKSRRSELNRHEFEFRQFVDKRLSGIPGDSPLTDVTAKKIGGGAARQAFLDEWELSLTTLRKLAKRFEEEKSCAFRRW